MNKLLFPALLTTAAAVTAPLAHAIESDTVSQLAFRAATTLTNQATLDFNLSYRAVEGFEAHEREIGEVRYGRKFGNDELMGAYHIEADRRGSLGNEHRLWLQEKHLFPLQQGSIESSLRLEERYFDYTYARGERLRWMTRWNKPLTQTDQFRVGYELVYNLNDISKSTVAGDAQDRFITSLQHNLHNGDRVEFEWQARYLHIVGAPNRIQNQLQVLYIYNF